MGLVDRAAVARTHPAERQGERQEQEHHDDDQRGSGVGRGLGVRRWGRLTVHEAEVARAAWWVARVGMRALFAGGKMAP